MSEKVRRFAVDNQGIADLIGAVEQNLNLSESDEIEIVCNPNYITIFKSGKRCFLCGNDKDISVLGNGRYVCKTCLKAVSNALEN